MDISISCDKQSNSRLANIIEGEIRIKKDESILIGCPFSESENPNELNVFVENKAWEAHKKKLSKLIVKCGDNQKLEYYPNEAVINPSQMSCEYNTDSTFHHETNRINNWMKYSQRFIVYDHATGINYNINIMDGMVDDKNNAIYTHMIMVTKKQRVSAYFETLLLYVRLIILCCIFF